MVRRRSKSPKRKSRKQRDKRHHAKIRRVDNNETERPNRQLSPASIDLSILEQQVLAGNKQATGQADSGDRDNIFLLAGRDLEEDTEVGDEIDKFLANFVKKVFVEKPNETKIKEKVVSYKKPANCTYLTAPLTNPEVWKVLDTRTKKTDTKLTNIQVMMTKASIAITKCATKLAQSNTELTKPLLDALTMLGRAHQCMTMQRKDQQKSSMPADLKALGDPTDASTSSSSPYLYGDDIKKKIKELKEQKSLLASLKDQPKYSHHRRYSGQRNARPFLGVRRGQYGGNQQYNPQQYGRYQQKHFKNPMPGQIYGKQKGGYQSKNGKYTRNITKQQRK